MRGVKKAFLALALSYLMLLLSTVVALSYTDQRGEIAVDGYIDYGFSCIRGSPESYVLHDGNYCQFDNEFFLTYFSDDAGASVCGQQMPMANIVQTSDQSVAADYCGLFASTYSYTYYENPGSPFFGGMSGNLGLYHPLKTFAPIGSEYMFPYMDVIEPEELAFEEPPTISIKDTDNKTMSGNNNTRYIFSPDAFNSSVKSKNETGKNETINETEKKDTSDKKAGSDYISPIPNFIIDPFWDLGTDSTPGNLTLSQFHRKAAPEEIYNMTSLERMYWNMHYTTKMDNTAIGPVCCPFTIAEYDDGFTMIPMPDMQENIIYGLNETLPWGRVHKRFWDL